MLKCLECGCLFPKGEEDRWEESGEFWGQPVSETVTGCPSCGGAYEEATPCVECGEEHLADDLYGGMCKKCLEPYVNDFDACLKLGEMQKESIEVNALLLTMFTTAEIEKILIRELKQSGSIDCSSFAYDDLEWFAENLRKEVLNNAKKNI